VSRLTAAGSRKEVDESITVMRVTIFSRKSDGAVSCYPVISRSKKMGLDVQRLTMDDDTTTYTRAKKSLFSELEKTSDRNHVLKNFSNGLYKIRESNKALTVQIINYLKKCVSYATSQNEGTIMNNFKDVILIHRFDMY